MIWQTPLNKLINRIQTHPSVTGICLFGSLATDDADAFSDIDLGITTPNDEMAMLEVFQVGYEFLDPVGLPIQTLERRWEHCQMIAALFGKLHYPPIGLEVDLVFSQTQHVGEQFQYTPYKVLYDLDGTLASTLESAIQVYPTPDDLIADIHAQLKAFPFLVHDALKALHRGDQIAGQFLLTELQHSVLKLASANHRQRLVTPKRAARWLSPDQEASAVHPFSRQTILAIITIFQDHVSRIDTNSPLQDQIKEYRHAIAALL